MDMIILHCKTKKHHPFRKLFPGRIKAGSLLFDMKPMIIELFIYK